MSSYLKSKKGNIGTDILITVVVIFVMAFIAVIFYSIQSDLAEDIIPEFNASGHNQSMVTMQQSRAEFAPIWDGGIVFLLFGLWFGTIIGAFMLDTHPIFFILGILILIPTMIGGIYLSNSTQDFMNDDSMSKYSEDFPMTIWIIQHILVIIIVMGCSLGLALYAKSQL
jgi:hypothetical protein